MYKKDFIGINLTKERLINFEKDYKNNHSLIFKDLNDVGQNATDKIAIATNPMK